MLVFRNISQLLHHKKEDRKDNYHKNANTNSHSKMIIQRALDSNGIHDALMRLSKHSFELLEH